jgi:hypothetical protein
LADAALQYDGLAVFVPGSLIQRIVAMMLPEVPMLAKPETSNAMVP